MLVESAEADKLSLYRPYPRQIEFHNTIKRERGLMAANQVGKTWCAGMEVAMHATGKYPDWFQGHRFSGPTHGWVAGVSGESTRDNPQRVLLGREEPYGTGAIPKVDLIHVTPSMGVSGLRDTISVKHVSGGTSTIKLKSYEKGREKWQGETLDWLWFDEEPPLDVYLEGLTRTNVKTGPVFVTFTPLKGASTVVRRFQEVHPDRVIVHMTLEDAAHYTKAQRRTIEASYPEHEREARARGIPVLGSGLVFPVTREYISVEPFEIPGFWATIGGIDFGWDHPTAAVKLRWDRDADIMYVTHAYRQARATPVIHAAALRTWGKNIPWAWPHDGYQHDKSSGAELAQTYREQGLDMLPEHATHEEGGFGIEASVTDLLDRMLTGRLKVFAHLNEWFEEQGGYYRKNGIIVKERDDLMSATRYAYMMRRYAETTEHTKPDRYSKAKKLGGSAWAA